MRRRSVSLFSFTVLGVIILAGCFQGEQSMEEIDVPEDVETLENLEESEAIEEDGDTNEEEVVPEDTEMVPRQLYLLDSNGMVAAQTIELPKPESNEVASQVLTYLVKDGPVTPLLPNGFQAVLPSGTEILGLNLDEEGTMTIDLSEEFTNYEPDEELSILQSMTYTVTQFENVDRIKLRIDGEPHQEMPVNNTPISEGFSRANGINIVNTNAVDLINSEAVTMYYPAEFNENRYFIPVTQYVEKKNESMYSSIVENLIKGSIYNNNVLHVFNPDTVLVDEPTLNQGILQLEFNENILMDPENKIISDEVVETLVRTLTEQEEVEAVDIKVENTEELVNENGEVYNEPVTNQSFSTTEKL